MEEQPEIQSMRYAQRERLVYIDYCLQYIGKVSRTSLVAQFNVGLASCSRDFKVYLTLAPQNLILKHTDKFYYRTDEFIPLFKHDPKAVLTSLIDGVTDGVSTKNQKADCLFDTLSLIAPDPDIVAAITRAIITKRPIYITYQSIRSGRTSRVIIPHAIVDTGHGWQVRAFDRKSNKFRGFVCTRIESLKSDESKVMHQELKTEDEYWQNFVMLNLVPHPRLKHKKPVELDYKMKNGQRQIEVRLALAGYLMRQWNIDCSHDASLKGAEHQLWLSNVVELENLVSMTIAPGYQHK